MNVNMDMEMQCDPTLRPVDLKVKHFLKHWAIIVA